MSGYSAVQFGASDLAARFPDYALWLGKLTLTQVQAEVYRVLHRRVEASCRDDGHSVEQMSDARVLIACECFYALYYIFSANAVPTANGVEDALALADSWKRRYEDEWDAVDWEYDDAVSAPTQSTQGRPALRFRRG